MKSIVQGWFMYLLYSLGFITDGDILNQLSHRMSKCENCPLKKGNFCSRHNHIEKIVHVKKQYGSVKSERKIISGCGCYLKAKYFSDFKLTKCPLGKWHL